MKPLPPKHKCPACDRAHFDKAGEKALNDHCTRCAECKQLVPYDYMLLPGVWHQTGLAYHAGVLHLECVEKLIGRKLQLEDFSTMTPRSAEGGHNINDAIRFGVTMAQRREPA